MLRDSGHIFREKVKNEMYVRMPSLKKLTWNSTCLEKIQSMTKANQFWSRFNVKCIEQM